jgi:hypothetical protein
MIPKSVKQFSDKIMRKHNYGCFVTSSHDPERQQLTGRDDQSRAGNAAAGVANDLRLPILLHLLERRSVAIRLEVLLIQSVDPSN